MYSDHHRRKGFFLALTKKGRPKRGRKMSWKKKNAQWLPRRLDNRWWQTLANRIVLLIDCGPAIPAKSQRDLLGRWWTKASAAWEKKSNKGSLPTITTLRCRLLSKEHTRRSFVIFSQTKPRFSVKLTLVPKNVLSTADARFIHVCLIHFSWRLFRPATASDYTILRVIGHRRDAAFCLCPNRWFSLWLCPFYLKSTFPLTCCYFVWSPTLCQCLLLFQQRHFIWLSASSHPREK